MATNAPGKAINSQQDMIANNMAMRNALLASAPRMRKNLGVFTTALGAAALGSTTRVKLFNVGVTTSLYIDVLTSVDIAGGVATPSTKAPYNLINRIRLTDFDGVDRVNLTGYQLWILQCIRNKTVYGQNNESAPTVGAIFAIPTAIAAASPLRFQLEVPLAYDEERDLRGALLTQTAVGEATLIVDWNTALLGAANADAVYVNGAGTVVINAASGIALTVEQKYLLPQDIGGITPLPLLDLMTVYELNGALRSSDNLAVGQPKLMNYPNMRSVIGAYFNYINNGVMNPATTDISRFRLIANGNNILQEFGAVSKMFEQRRWLTADGDLRPGTYFQLHRNRPIETALYGNVQFEITPLTFGGGNSGIEIAYESFYTKGSALPGVSQGS
jgi:hypothetical protein